ncbi:MAG TPA: Nramp family divalent metal transporter [Thermoanaerobaculia bacterium]|nr:Nramp family divalent metal transporter [Thermoanaerobaculia bacterium]
MTTNLEPIPARPAGTASLPEVHGSVHIPTSPQFWRRLFAFAGPAYMVSVGYMDPGNWATDIEGGSRFAYQLLWVLLMSNLMAVLLQTLSARLGIVTGRDLAQSCRESYPRPVGLSLWILCELAIGACDLAEVLGTAIGLHLLFGIDLMTGVLITAFDVFLLLAMQRFGIRRMEAFILTMVATIGACYVVEIFLVKPDWGPLLGGFRPRLQSKEALYIAIGMIGATVMPHNLYLHSALVQTRQVARTREGMRQANRYNFIDSAIALNCAFFVNAAILVLAAGAFHRNGVVVTELGQAHQLLAPLLGTSIASAAFAVALLFAGQSSTLTGTLAGQVVMEGFLQFRMRPWLRRLMTRALALIPAVITIAVLGDQGTYKLLILSQVILSLQLPFAVVPLVQFTSDRKKMGEFANRLWLRIGAWVTALVIIGLNVKLVIDFASGWLSGPLHPLARIALLAILASVGLLLLYVAVHPYLPRLRRGRLPAGKKEATFATPPSSVRTYRRIAAALAVDDHDHPILEHGISLARGQGAELLLIHVAEGFGPRFFGQESTDTETREDARYLEAARTEAESAGVSTRIQLRYGEPVAELARAVEEEGIDLLVMGSHGHKLAGDILFGSTVDPLRHRLKIPVLVVRED